ncbi:MAG: hypothetical protein FWD60_05865 [Candidatus Azobacteroides sp.]|nr:hypothetical protein [Candidatus Azobacteroides sp.]
MTKFRFAACFFAILLFLSCQKNENRNIDFYYWRSNVSFNSLEKEYFNNLQVKKLYIRLFDVDQSAGMYPEPIGMINQFDGNELDTEYIPTVFITNRTFENLPTENVKLLAENVYRQIEKILYSCNIKNFNEVQIDCDWTNGTHRNYFHFLEELKKISDKKISCTLRLHQIKYRKKMGIPPVDKGCLMCYATSSPKDDDDKNSILDIALLKDYLSDVENYPLDFDIALPLYSWAVVRNHLGKIKLINGVTAEELQNNEHFEKITGMRFRVVDDIFFGGMYLNEGFIIDIEYVTPELLNTAKNYIGKKLKNKNYNIIYFHLDSIFLKRFSIKELQ